LETEIPIPHSYLKYGHLLLYCCLRVNNAKRHHQPKGGDALRLGVKAGIVRVWVAGKTV